VARLTDIHFHDLRHAGNNLAAATAANPRQRPDSVRRDGNGGWIIAQEPLRHPTPRSFPHLPALDTYWELFHRLVEGFGAPAQAVEQLPRSAAAAGLEVVRVDGSFIVHNPDQGFAIHAGALAAAPERATAAGLVTGEEIDRLVSDLRTAGNGGYQWVTSPFLLDLTLRKSGGGNGEIRQDGETG